LSFVEEGRGEDGGEYTFGTNVRGSDWEGVEKEGDADL
jgi:hypothetical protein